MVIPASDWMVGMNVMPFYAKSSAETGKADNIPGQALNLYRVLERYR
jgi:hypothetical protein